VVGQALDGLPEERSRLGGVAAAAAAAPALCVGLYEALAQALPVGAPRGEGRHRAGRDKLGEAPQDLVGLSVGAGCGLIWFGFRLVWLGVVGDVESKSQDASQGFAHEGSKGERFRAS